MAQSIRKLMKRPVVLHTDDTLVQAARAMKENDIGSVLVCDLGGHIVGVCTDRDLAMSIANGGSDQSTPLADVMNNEVYAVGENFTTDEIVDVMARFGVRRIPVVRTLNGGKERCVGVVSLDDVIATGEINPDQVKRVVQQQISDAQRVRRRSPLAISERSFTRQEQSYQRFLRAVSEETGLSEKGADRFAHLVTNAILRRLSESQARKLLAQFPRRMQLDMTPQISEPDRSIDANLILSEIAVRFAMDSAQAEDALCGYFNALSRLISDGALRQLYNALPKSMQQLVLGGAIGASRRADGRMAEVTRLSDIRQRRSEPQSSNRGEMPIQPAQGDGGRQDIASGDPTGVTKRPRTQDEIGTSPSDAPFVNTQGRPEAVQDLSAQRGAGGYAGDSGSLGKGQSADQLGGTIHRGGEGMGKMNQEEKPIEAEKREGLQPGEGYTEDRSALTEDWEKGEEPEKSREARERREEREARKARGEEVSEDEIPHGQSRRMPDKPERPDLHVIDTGGADVQETARRTGDSTRSKGGATGTNDTSTSTGTSSESGRAAGGSR